MNNLYRDSIKPALDKVLAIGFIIFFWWLYLALAILVRVKLGSPVLFTQKRPGKIDPRTGKERIFKLYKFRSMTDERDADGNLLPDKDRLTSFGKFLRSTSLDELPEILFNIALADPKDAMSFVGPRPQLVRDMVFMSKRQRKRHLVSPGITGLAQVKGRNAITWEEKLDWDLKYVKRISFPTDLFILLETIAAVFKRSGITDGENATALDFGDALLKAGKVSREEYDKLQREAEMIIE